MSILRWLARLFGFGGESDPEPVPITEPPMEPRPEPEPEPEPEPIPPSGPIPAEAPEATAVELVSLNGRAANNGYVTPLALSIGKHELRLRVTMSAHPDPAQRQAARESLRLAGFNLHLLAVEEAKLRLYERWPNTRNPDGTVKYWSQKFGSDHVALLPKEASWAVLEGEVALEKEPEQQASSHVVYALSWIGDELATLEIVVPIQVKRRPDPERMVYVDFSVERMHKPGTLGGRMPIQVR